MIDYRDGFVQSLAEDIERLIAGESVSPETLFERLLELAERNCPAVARYFADTARGRGVPDTAFKSSMPYLFPGVEPEICFETSGTSGSVKGRAPYSPLGAQLLRSTIVTGARAHITQELERPAIVRLVPSQAQAPTMVMAHGMELISNALGDGKASGSVVGPAGVDFAALSRLLGRAIAADQPVVLIGGSFAFVNLCERLVVEKKRFALPKGSRVVDAGGFKGRSRSMPVDALRALIADRFGVAPGRFTNIFGMTELASQLYDDEDRPLGPLGERPKVAAPYVWPRLRSPFDMNLTAHGQGLLEVVDLCILDRPCVVLTGDLAVGDGRGIALAGRAQLESSRGCSLTLDTLTKHAVDDARA